MQNARVRNAFSRYGNDDNGVATLGCWRVKYSYILESSKRHDYDARLLYETIVDEDDSEEREKSFTSVAACSNPKIPEGIKGDLPGRDCMAEDRMTTHGWGACTSIEGTRAPSIGDAIEQTIDSTRLARED
jgi:hypothetical protein